MKFYTKSYLENLAENSRRKVKTFSQVIQDSHQKSSFDIFLSHSFLDKKLIKGLYEELTSKGNTVYVDWITDADLDRKKVTKETVERIRMRMKQCKSLIYATSESASISKWMPWELGYMDGTTNRSSILPITEHETSIFNGQEFLSVYPLVALEEIGTIYNSKKIVNVYNDSNTKVYASLNEWKQGKEPYYHY